MRHPTQAQPISDRQPLLSTTVSETGLTQTFPTPYPPNLKMHLPSYSSIEESCQPQQPTPLPKKQLAIICIMRFTEPISFTVIFPFINQMLEDLKITPDRTRIGFYAGLIESLFAFAQLCTALYWGRLSDRIGRKPVILLGLFGLAISVITFGLQSSLTGLIVTRALAGMMNGNIGILRSVIREITDHTNHAQALAFLPLCYALGGIMGPLLGGYLAQPATQYPALFGSSDFLKAYPYALPGIAAGLFNLCAILLGLFYLEESLPSKKPPNRQTVLTAETQLKLHLQQPQPRQATIRSLLDRNLLGILLSFFILNLQTAAWNSLIPFFAYTRIEDGGLSLSLDQIGFCLSLNGLGLLIVQVFIFPSLQRRFAPLALYRYTYPTHGLSFVLLPFLGLLVSVKTGQEIALTGLSAILVLKSPGLISYVCISVLLNTSAPASSLGTLNGLAMTFTALAYTIGPFLASGLYSMSIRTHFLGGNLVWVVMVSISSLGYLASWLIPEKEEVGKTLVVDNERRNGCRG